MAEFKHDCDCCRFLGTINGPDPRVATHDHVNRVFDLYFCARCDGGTVIARRSSIPSDYSSCPVSMLHKNSHPALLWASAILDMEKLADQWEYTR